MKITNFHDSVSFINQAKVIDFENSFALSKLVAALLSEKETEQDAREIIIRILDVWGKVHIKTRSIWNDLIQSSGLYPYVEQNKLTGSSCLRQEYHKSNYLDNVYLHEEQANLSILLNKSQSVVVSAPTSFGKSLLIEEIVARKVYKNIVIIQPTLALLDETRKKLLKYSNFYRLIVSTKQQDTADRNIFLFTGERVVEYQYFPKIDFFVIDEFYKLSLARDDERAASLNHALYRLLKMTNNFYMLGPNIKRVTAEFINKYNATWVHSNFATVAVDVENVISSKKAKKEEKERGLFSLLPRLLEPTLIYCSSPSKVNIITKDFLSFLSSAESDQKNLPKSSNQEIIQWIDENIHRDWILRRALEHSIAFHHGGLPRHLASSIVDLFNKKEINYLFSTSTLIEGVNTSAKNVVLFDGKKGPKPIDYFDFKNIIGRAGRMNRHFVGKVFKFNPDPEQFEFDVDIPLFNQEKAPLELLVQLENKDLKSEGVDRIKEFSKLSKEKRELLKANKGVSIEGQLQLLQILEKERDVYQDLLCWKGVPNYKQLKATLELGLRHLLKKGESRRYSAGQLAVFTLDYVHFKSLKAIINKNLLSDYWIQQIPDENERLQRIIQDVLQIAQHWLEYKLPKLLVALSSLQEFVFAEYSHDVGNYTILAGLIENDFLPTNLTVLLEYGIPPSAIRKLAKVIKDNISQEEVINKIKTIDLNKLDLLNYEKKKILNLFET